MSLLTIQNEIKFRNFIKRRAEGWTQTVLMHRCGISRATYYRWIHYDDDNIPLQQQDLGGRPRMTTIEDDDLIGEVALDNRFQPLKEWRNDPRFADRERIMFASNSTLYRRLNEKGIHKCIAAVKQRLTQIHREKRLSYAIEFEKWKFEDWCRAIFIDEFGVDTSDNGKVRVWRVKGTRYDQSNITETTRNTRQTFSFIVSFSFHGLGPIMKIERFSKEVYVEYLEQQLLLYINEYFEDGNYLLLHDNHPAHVSHYVKDWVADNMGDPKDVIIPHPPCSPDLNPVENVGAMLKQLVRLEKPRICNRDVLWDTLLSAHQNLAQNRDYFIRLIQSMPDRLKEVIEKNGGQTHY